MIPKSLCRSFHEESRKFQRSHHSFKKKVNRPEQKQQTSSSLFVKTKKEGSIHELVNGEKQKKLRNEPLTKYNSNVYKSPIKSYVVNDNKILPKVKSKKHLLHKSYITK